LRQRLAARSGALKLEIIVPHFGSLARDPVHPATYYLAADVPDSSPVLLHLALASAPTSSIFSKPLLIGRMRPASGPEFVVNAIPFGPEDRENVERFAASVDTAFLPRPQSTRASITVESDFAGAFAVFHSVHKRTGKNLAALAGDYHLGVWSAIRAGWRHEYSMVAYDVPETLAYTRFVIDVSAIEELDPALKAVEARREEIRRARAFARIGGAFEYEIRLGRTTALEVETAIEHLQSRGQGPQFVGVDPGSDLESLATIARRRSVTLSFRGGSGELAAAATSGKLNYYASTPAEAEAIAEAMLG
jgi:hypothetical protein